MSRIIYAVHGVVIRRPIDARDVDALATQEIRQAQLLIDPPRNWRRLVGDARDFVGWENQVITCFTDGLARNADSAACAWRITTGRPPTGSFP